MLNLILFQSIGSLSLEQCVTESHVLTQLLLSFGTDTIKKFCSWKVCYLWGNASLSENNLL